MKKMLSLLLALAVLCMSMAALAEEGEKVTLELNTARLPVYAADDPYLNGLTSAGDGLPVSVRAGRTARSKRRAKAWAMPPQTALPSQTAA